MRVTVVRPGDLGATEAELWGRFQQSSPLMLSPYLSLTFAQTIGQIRNNARVAVVENSGEIEAFLPFELASGKVAQPIGYPMNDLQGIIGSSALIDVRSVVRKVGLRGWRFYHALAEQRALAPYCYDGTTVRCTVIDLTDGYKSYFSSRSKSGTRRTAEKRRSLERQFGPVSLEWSSSRPEHLRQLIEWKSGKYSSTRRMFCEDPTAQRIVEELATANKKDCSGVVSVLLAGERIVAVHLGLLGPRGLSSWFPSYDGELSRFSPGMMMWFPIAEEAASRGVTRIDFGYGQHDYKFRLANDSYPVAGGAVWASRTDEVARKIYRRLGFDRLARKERLAPADPSGDRA
jgi:CelD/BcsL family acetyltransferase involved in cellulose biosynthesis